VVSAILIGVDLGRPVGDRSLATILWLSPP